MIPYDDPTGAAGDRSTHAVDIIAFIDATELVHHHVETPYRLLPSPGGEQLYALLRDTLERTGRIAIAYVVIQARQHLAALVPRGRSLMLNTLRWTCEASFATPEPLQEDDAEQIDDLAQLTSSALGFTSHGRPPNDTAFRADILTPDFLTEDEADIDSALAYALRSRANMHAAPTQRPQRPVRRGRNTRARLRSRLLS